MTTDSMPSVDVTWNNAAGGNTTANEIVAAPSNTNVLYMWALNKVYVSINRGATWTWTGLTVNYSVNGVDKQHDWMAVDPQNPDIVYLVTPHGTFGPADASSGTLLVNTTGRSCTVSCWSAVSGIPTPSGHNGGNVIFDPTSSVVGGVKQGIYAAIQGSSGIWHSTNGGSAFTQQNTGSPPSNIFDMTVDSFGQLWAVEGAYGAVANKIFRFASSSWNSITVGSSATYISILQDPNSIGGSVGNNQMIVVDVNGQISATLNNGTDSWAHTIGLPSLTMVSNSPQAGWINVANQYFTGLLTLNVNSIRFSASGTMFVATGIDMFTAPDPIVTGALSTTLAYSANTIGADQLVGNLFISPPGLGLFSAVWDRGIFSNLNPDVFAASQYPNNANNCSGCGIILLDTGLSYAPTAPWTLVAIGGEQGSFLASTSNGGGTWGATAGQPAVGVSGGGVTAASTATDWAIVPGEGVPQVSVVSYTTNAGTSWATASFTGSPSPAAFIAANIGHGLDRQPLAADQVTAGTYYIVDLSQNFFKGTTTGGVLTFAPTGATAASIDGVVQSDRLIAEPGQAGHVWYLGESGHLWKSVNGATTFTNVSGAAGLDNISGFGFGAPKPGGPGCSSVYAYQIPGTAPQGYYASFDCGSTWASLNVPASELVYPSHVLDFPSWVTGDGDVYGRLYVAVKGSGPGYYIDTQDACPWVKFSNTLPNASLTGTVTLQATQSGRVPVTSVVYKVDGVTIGTQTTGSGTPTVYSQSWVTGGVATGAHTISLSVAGNGCTASESSIPVTTH